MRAFFVSKIIPVQQSALCWLLLLILFPFSSAWPRFDLVKEWITGEGEYGPIPNLSGRFADGSHYFHDYSPDAQYPIWRLQGGVISPVTWISHQQLGGGSATFFAVEDWIVMRLRGGEGQGYWRLDESSITALAPIWGPLPTTETRFFLYTDEGVFFSGVHPEYGRELWLLDKTGYKLLGDVNPGTADSHPSFVSLLPHVGSTSQHRLFRLDDGSTGLEPWVYHDGTLSLVGDLQEGPEGSWPLRLGIRGSDIYFWGNYYRIFKYDGETASLIVQDSALAPAGDPSSGYFIHEGDLYTWRATCCGWDGYVGRILPDDTVQRLRTYDWWHFPYQHLELHSVVPWKGAIETQGPSDSETFKVSTELPVFSPIFQPWADAPIARKFTENELLFQETGYGSKRGHVFCLQGESGRAVWRGDGSGYGRAYLTDGEDWMYLVYANNAAELAEADGITQIWAMKWPEGCQDAWIEELIFSSGFE